jgi:hypothetical protein
MFMLQRMHNKIRIQKCTPEDKKKGYRQDDNEESNPIQCVWLSYEKPKEKTTKFAHDPMLSTSLSSSSS